MSKYQCKQCGNFFYPEDEKEPKNESETTCDVCKENNSHAVEEFTLYKINKKRY